MSYSRHFQNDVPWTSERTRPDIITLCLSGHNGSFVLLHTLSPITEDAMKNNYSRVPQPHTLLMCFYSSDILTDCRSERVNSH